MSLTKTKPASNLLNDYHLLSFDALDSTNEEAKRLARAGGGHGAVIWAKKQTAGRGRMDRAWESHEGNLFVSVLLKPEKTMLEFSQISFVAAVAVMDTLAALVPDSAALRCKWPNDILLFDKKLGGILIESFKAGEEGGAWVVVGVGINVDSFPPKTEFPATCMKDAGVELISAKIILSRFIHHFIERYNEWNTHGFAPIRKQWLATAWHMHKLITARLPDKNLSGIFEGIDEHGNLILGLKGDKRQYINAADVFPPEKKE